MNYIASAIFICQGIFLWQVPEVVEDVWDTYDVLILIPKEAKE